MRYGPLLGRRRRRRLERGGSEEVEGLAGKLVVELDAGAIDGVHLVVDLDRALQPAPADFARDLVPIASAITTSVPIGRCGPCASTAPIGRIATERARSESRTSVHVISVRR